MDSSHGSYVMAITQGYKDNFATLRRASMYEDLALMECTRVSDNSPVVVVCAVNLVEGEYEFVPLAEMCSGNPYETYLPPM